MAKKIFHVSLRRAAWRWRRWIICVVILAACIASELRLRERFNPGEFYVRKPGWDVIFRPSQAGTPGILDEAHVRINDLGLRGDKPAPNAAPTILAVGSSTTEEMQLNDSETWTGQMQSMMRRCYADAWVGNMGKSGVLARHNADQMEKVIPHLPRIDRVIALVGLPDMLYASRIHYPKDLPESWHRLIAFDHIPPEQAYLRSAVVQAVMEKLSVVRAFADSIWRLELPKSSGPLIVDFGKMMEGYKNRYRAVEPDDFISDVPPLDEALSRFRASLENLVRTGASLATEVTFVTQPSIWKPAMTPEEKSRLYAGGLGSPDNWFVDPHNKWFDTAVLKQMLAAFNAVTLDVCSKRNLTCVDLASQLPKAAENFFDDFHFSRRGAATAAELITRTVARCN